MEEKNNDKNNNDNEGDAGHDIANLYVQLRKQHTLFQLGLEEKKSGAESEFVETETRSCVDCTEK